MRYVKALPVIAALILLTIGGCERKVINQITTVADTEKAAYVGSEACKACHRTTWESFKKTGHPYELNDADSVQMPGYFPDFVTPLEIPPDLGWNDIGKVVGGFWWKARFIAPANGAMYIGPDRQYNLIEGYEGFAAYEGTTPGFKAYDCGPCHMTAYRNVGHQEGKDSLIGTWAFNGIQCEECHGPGGAHARNPYENPMRIDRSAEQCGKCHSHDNINTIPASGGFIENHEQWNEMFATKHNALECVDCHEPHIGLHPGNPDRHNAIVNRCENCHLAETQSYAASDLPHYTNGVDCITCHMPYAVKSAVQQETYVGDVHSHLMVINTDPTATLMKNSSEANPYLTLEYTCLKAGCHNPDLPGNTKVWAAANADRVHAPNITDAAGCFTCHADDDFALIAARQGYDMSLHGTGETYNRNRNNSSFYRSCEPCHTNEGFVATVTGIPAVGDHFTRISCFTCHKPHTSGTLALRIQNPVTLLNGLSYNKGNSNICASCHQSRSDIRTYITDSTTLSERWGPHHGTQSDLLMGTNGYEYDGYDYESSPHQTAEGGCLKCHMTNSLYATGGHSFNMADDANEYENVRGCNTDCHGGAVTTFDHEGKQSETVALLDSLETLLLDAGLIEWVDDAGEMVLLPTEGRVVATADSVGALFNYLFVKEDRSEGIHNLDYAQGLLESSLEFLTGGITPPSSHMTMLPAH